MQFSERCSDLPVHKSTVANTYSSQQRILRQFILRTIIPNSPFYPESSFCRFDNGLVVMRFDYGEPYIAFLQLENIAIVLLQSLRFSRIAKVGAD